MRGVSEKNNLLCLILILTLTAEISRNDEDTKKSNVKIKDNLVVYSVYVIKPLNHIGRKKSFIAQKLAALRLIYLLNSLLLQVTYLKYLSHMGVQD
jgi:hypothetical protein